MNKPIRTISAFCLVLFLALLANATYLQYWAAGDYGDDARNRRVVDAEYSRERGAILVGRTPVAQSVPVDDQYEFLREYPMPFQYAPVTGYFGYGGAVTGIEKSQNDVLSGDDDRLFVTRLVDLLSNEAAKGGDISLTINKDAQQAAWDGLNELGEGTRGAVVALEPATGKVLAMVSTPSFDPATLASHDFAANQAAYDALAADPAKPLLNRAVQDPLPPGSTFKIVTAAAALESGRYTADGDVPGGSTYQLPQTSGETGLVDNQGRACGSGNDARIPFSQALEQSCNTTFARLAVELGGDALREQAEKFGFNQEYFEDLQSTSGDSTQAVSTFPDELNPPQTGQAGFGQFDVRATPLQMAMVVAGIANQGRVMKPYLVGEVQSADSDTIDAPEPEELSQAVSPETAAGLTEMLVNTVNDGTAGPAAIPGIQVAGKTGTAESGRDDVPPYAWFVSFAPADNPQVAVAVMIESADVDEIAGGLLGGPIAKSVMEAVLKP